VSRALGHDALALSLERLLLTDHGHLKRFAQVFGRRRGMECPIRSAVEYAATGVARERALDGQFDEVPVRGNVEIMAMMAGKLVRPESSGPHGSSGRLRRGLSTSRSIARIVGRELMPKAPQSQFSARLNPTCDDWGSDADTSSRLRGAHPKVSGFLDRILVGTRSRSASGQTHHFANHFCVYVIAVKHYIR
jgi:hypothetical protein